MSLAEMFASQNEANLSEEILANLMTANGFEASEVSVDDLVKKLLPRLRKCVAEIEHDLNLQN